MIMVIKGMWDLNQFNMCFTVVSCCTCTSYFPKVPDIYHLFDDWACLV